jgi:hypothetical protein
VEKEEEEKVTKKDIDATAENPAENPPENPTEDR